MTTNDLINEGYHKYTSSLYRGERGYVESWEKWFYEDGNKVYSIHIDMWVFEANNRLVTSMDAHAQLENKDGTFNVSLLGVKDKTVFDVELFFGRVYCRMECKPYAN